MFFVHAQLCNSQIDSSQILYINSLGGRSSNIVCMTSNLVEGGMPNLRGGGAKFGLSHLL